MKKFTIGLSAAFALPLLALAQTGNTSPQLTNIQQFATAIGSLVKILLPIVVAIALLAFFWGLARFIFAAGDEVDAKKGKDMMIYGIIALFVMVSVWGLVQFIGNALGIGSGGTVTPPSVSGF